MLYLGRNQNINSKISMYIKEQTNKSMEKYLNEIDVRNNKHNLAKQQLLTLENIECKNCKILLPVVSIISFLFGYNLCKLINK